MRGIRDLVALSPPLVVTHDELDRMFAALTRALDRLFAGRAERGAQAARRGERP